MKNALKFSFFAAAMLIGAATDAFAWHDHYRGGVVIYDGYGYGPGYYAPPPVIMAPPPPAYAYPAYPGYAPSAGMQYAPVPDAPVYQAQNGQYCREYTSNINVGGQIKKTYGTACRQPDGAWKLVN